MNRPFRPAALVSAVLAALGIAAAGLTGGRPDCAVRGRQAGRAHVSGALLVKFRDGAAAPQPAAVWQGPDAQKSGTVRRDQGEPALMKLPAIMAIADAVRALRSNPLVEYAKPNWICEHTDACNDPRYTIAPWGGHGDATGPVNPYGA